MRETTQGQFRRETPLTAGTLTGGRKGEALAPVCSGEAVLAPALAV